MAGQPQGKSGYYPILPRWYLRNFSRRVDHGACEHGCLATGPSSHLFRYPALGEAWSALYLSSTSLDGRSHDVSPRLGEDAQFLAADVLQESAGAKRVILGPILRSVESGGYLPPILGAKVGAPQEEKSRKWPYGLQIQGN